ncbi:MAG: response regulator transcription factor [Eubacterium sp.]|nr:response regulator transcription factor [Eubacterium sp.]
MKHIFLLEDDEAIGVALTYSLEREGYRVTLAKSVDEAMRLTESDVFSLYILDLSLPDGSGYEVCRAVKAQGDYPVIFLTAFDDEANVVMGFDLGADDYIAKPFRLKELLARVRCVLRRYSQESTGGVVRLQQLTVNTNEAKVYKNGKEIILTAMEYRLLLTLLQHKGRVLTRSNLLEELWDVEGDFVNDNTLTVYIKRLRDKIEDDPTAPTMIKTVRGMGYILDEK